MFTRSRSSRQRPLDATPGPEHRPCRPRERRWVEHRSCLLLCAATVQVFPGIHSGDSVGRRCTAACTRLWDSEALTHTILKSDFLVPTRSDKTSPVRKCSVKPDSNAPDPLRFDANTSCVKSRPLLFLPVTVTRIAFAVAVSCDDCIQPELQRRAIGADGLLVPLRLDRCKQMY